MLLQHNCHFVLLAVRARHRLPLCQLHVLLLSLRVEIRRLERRLLTVGLMRTGSARQVQITIVRIVGYGVVLLNLRLQIIPLRFELFLCLLGNENCVLITVTLRKLSGAVLHVLSLSARGRLTLWQHLLLLYNQLFVVELHRT